ncbi:MAG: hypothetical protein WBQ14_09150 [Gaiellaceae bacterium]
MKPLPVFRSIDSSVVLPSSWVAAGALFGLASALILHWSAPEAVVAAAAAGALSWLARGIANLVLAVFVLLISIASVFQAVHYVFSGANWSLTWLGPCALAGLIGLLLIGRRLRLLPGSGRVGALIELIAAATSLLIAIRFVMRVSPGSSDHAALFLTGAEDNDAWINLVGLLRSGGATALTGSSMGVLGSVVPTYLAFVRAASGGLLHTAVPLSSSPKVVLSAYGLSIATVPVVVALIVRRVIRLRHPIATLIIWGSVTALVASYCVIVSTYGSLSVSLTVLLALTAAYLVATRPRLRAGRAQIVWLVSTLLLFGAGSAWIPVTPLAGAAIAASCIPVLGFGIKDRRRMIPATVLGLSALVLVLELWQQYRYAVGGGLTALFEAGGATPAVTEATLALILLLLFATVALSSSRIHFARKGGFVTSLTWLVGYVLVVLLLTARATGAAPGYGPTKLQFVLAGVFVPLAVLEVVSRLEIGRRQLNVIAIIVVGVLWADTVQSGPLYDAVTRHWPAVGAKPVWLDAVQHETKLGGRVLCLSSDYPSIESYLCNRYTISLQVKDDSVSGVWQQVALGRMPASSAVSQVEAVKDKPSNDKPWHIVVIGQMDQIKNPKAWWAPIVELPGLKFVQASG